MAKAKFSRSVIKQSVINWYEKIKKASKILNVQAKLKQGILEVGDYTYGINDLHIDNYRGSEAKIIIGKYCSLSKNIRLIPGGIHPTNWISTFPFRIQLDLPGKFEDGMPLTKGNIQIGNDVWIGTGVTILSGVTIGHGSVVSACSVVTKDVKPYSIVAGNPAKLVRYRFPQERISELLDMAWWDWPIEKIKKNIDFLNVPFG